MREKSAAHAGLRERKKQATRVALVEAAVRLGAKHGVEHVTVDAISRAAGVSPRTFFNYFTCRDDVFVLTNEEPSARIRRAMSEASPDLTPLHVLREAMTVELAEIERRHDLWRLHAELLRKSPHLLARTIGAHVEDELALAEAVAERVGTSGAGGPGPGLYPRLVAAVGVTALRVAAEHWSARQDEALFTDVFDEAFEQLAAGLPTPSGCGAH
ncbi:TetR/AcrR family transcriptional regulator [Streptomyces sp. NPDC057376]|uniref:TetR/AcrR family transcriptional regulator n=1 Tax=Streptomyces sp. NPDC057376 TaxID=3346110 RepID=UPI0036286A10